MNHRGLPRFPRLAADRPHETRTRVHVSFRSHKHQYDFSVADQTEPPVPERDDNPVSVSDSHWIKTRIDLDLESRRWRLPKICLVRGRFLLFYE